MAEAKVAEGELAAAESFYRSALAEDPHDLGALVGFARLMAAQPVGYAPAEMLLKQACAFHPSAAAPRRALADIYHATGRHGLAREEQLQAERLAERAAIGGRGREGDAAKGGLF